MIPKIVNAKSFNHYPDPDEGWIYKPEGYKHDY